MPANNLNRAPKGYVPPTAPPQPGNPNYKGQPIITSKGSKGVITKYVDENGDTRILETGELYKRPKEWYESAAETVGGWLGIGGGPSSESNLKTRLDEQIARGNPYVTQRAYGDRWAQLLAQLQAQASGKAPSLAEMQYRQANMDQQAAIGSLGRSSGRPGAIRAAIQQQSRLGQGLAAGSAQARLQEQLANQQMYSGALSNATNFESQRQLANASAYQNLARIRLGVPKEQTEAEKWAGYVAKGAMIAATVL